MTFFRASPPPKVYQASLYESSAATLVVRVVLQAVAAAVRRGLLRLVARRVVLVARRVPQRVRDDRVIVKVCERIIIHGAGSDLLLAPW